jgi:FkbM family methyltransferase
MLSDRVHASNLWVFFDKARFHVARRLGLLAALCPENNEFLRYMHARGSASRSQIGQDLFVLQRLNEKRGGYFVDFGATDGVSLSNTYLLETDYGWQGLCAEPSRRWHQALKTNRRCAIETRCVWSCSGDRLPFTECRDREYSTLTRFADSDSHAELRAHEADCEYHVESVSLTDMLSDHDAPPLIDYLSIDTEGSELEILSAHDFERFRFRVITVEHNHIGDRRRGIARLLADRGYRRIMPSLSVFDDWYTLRAD